MNELKYRWVLYIIVFVIVGTIGVQAYLNYKNYLANKQQLFNDVQLSLDTAVEAYFANLAESNTFAIAVKAVSIDSMLTHKPKIDSALSSIKIFANRRHHPDSISERAIKNLEFFRGLKRDTIIEHPFFGDDVSAQFASKIVLKNHDVATPTGIQLDNFKDLTSKVMISMTSDSLKLGKIDTLLQKELKTKALDIGYKLSYQNEWNFLQELHKNDIGRSPLEITSKSTFLPRNSILKIRFSDVTKIILKRMLSSLLISTLLVLTVISCLFYLLKIIKHQKQIAEVKNDLISNITHEFKTPIATIGVAIEGIKSFNVIDDKEKTRSYLDMSGDQLSKLNVMVEKLLETATLDSESLELNKEETNITDLITVLVNKHKMQTDDKALELSVPKTPIFASIDIFHFENTINNIIDNAIKYGGDLIKIDLSQNSFLYTISVCDNGNSLTKAHKEKIFEKFYRIPKGNTHDVKGFGIGLYYSKKIIEKHGGTIHLDLNNNQTCFKVSLPN